MKGSGKFGTSSWAPGVLCTCKEGYKYLRKHSAVVLLVSSEKKQTCSLQCGYTLKSNTVGFYIHSLSMTCILINLQIKIQNYRTVK